ncbi:MAG: HepT-like ribonuclease domain-containing protein [Geminicoccaceae bacterium]
MARASVHDRLRHVLDEIALIRSFVAERSRDDHRQMPMLRRAVERSLEIISEATRHIPAPMRAAHPEIPWRSVADIGNVLRHGYDQIADDRIWMVVEQNLDPLEWAVRSMLADDEKRLAGDGAAGQSDR